MGTNNDIGNGIKNRLHGYTKSPDTLVWTKIEADLKKKKRRRLILILFFAISLSLLTLLLYRSNTVKITQESPKTETPTLTIYNSKKKKGTKANKALNDSVFITEDLAKTIKVSTKKDNSTKINGSYYLNDDDDDSKSNSSQEYNYTSNTFSKSNTSQLKKDTILSTNNNRQFDSLNKNSKNFKKLIGKTETNQTASFKSSDKQEDSISNKLKPDSRQDSTSKLDSIKPNKIKQWSIFPHTSLDYFGSLNHSSTNNIFINFGFKISYQATEDLSLRLGANRLTLNFSSNEASNNFMQKINYLELPLEFKQKLVRGKINTSIIAGVSYLLLDYAELTTNNIPNNFQIDTIEDSNMSLNLGLGFDTKLSKNLNFNIEPMLKYHFKPLENRLKSQTFILSIIGGLEYKF
ncbi:hypothetical protein [Olleya sp. R77988]|uniref:hypothetical protein n=1 Tax=Olleya sp. R77988 TaxID=3093875 RepID=UPI0037CA0456